MNKGKQHAEESPERQSSSGEQSPARMRSPLLQALSNEFRRHTSPQLSGQSKSPRSSSRPSSPAEEKSSSGGNSPRGGRISRTIGKKESHEIKAKIEEISLTEVDLEARLKALENETNTDQKRRELEAILAVKPTSLSTASLLVEAETKLLGVIAQKIATTFQNRLTYLGVENQKEADNQISSARKLFWEQFDELLKQYEGSRIRPPHEHRWNVLIRTIPIFLNIEKCSKKELPKDLLEREKEKQAITKELFMPK